MLPSSVPSRHTFIGSVPRWGGTVAKSIAPGVQWPVGPPQAIWWVTLSLSELISHSISEMGIIVTAPPARMILTIERDAHVSTLYA